MKKGIFEYCENTQVLPNGAYSIFWRVFSIDTINSVK